MGPYMRLKDLLLKESNYLLRRYVHVYIPLKTQRKYCQKEIPPGSYLQAEPFAKDLSAEPPGISGTL